MRKSSGPASPWASGLGFFPAPIMRKLVSFCQAGGDASDAHATCPPFSGEATVTAFRDRGLFFCPTPEPRLAPRCLGAPPEPGQPLCHRVPSVAGSGLSDTGTPACVLCMECISHGTGRSACATRETKYYSHSFSDDCQPRYVVKISGVMGYKRAGVLAIR